MKLFVNYKFNYTRHKPGAEDIGAHLDEELDGEGLAEQVGSCRWSLEKAEFRARLISPLAACNKQWSFFFLLQINRNTQLNSLVKGLLR